VFGLFKKKQPSVVVVTLNARLRPDDRADLEDAFDDFMSNNGHGARVVGGGTMMADNGEVAECDIEIELDDPTAAMINAVVETFSAMLAPKGSRIHISEQDRRIDFGSHEGLALYLNGTSLPDEVYKSCDSNHVYDECGRLIEGVGLVSSHWQGPEETALYMYGSSFSAMHERLIPFLETYPLCQHCRVVQIA
jgi:hypothetical protein